MNTIVMIGEISKLDCNLKPLNHEINAYLIKTNTCFSLTKQNKAIITVFHTIHYLALIMIKFPLRYLISPYRIIIKGMFAI